MSNNTQYIEQLCQEIKSSGQSPSVGLIRSRAKKKLAIKEVIETLKLWKESPQLPNFSLVHLDGDTTEATLDIEDRVTTLENDVLELKAQLRLLLNPDLE